MATEGEESEIEPGKFHGRGEVNYPEIADEPFENIRVRDIRLRIAKQIGANLTHTAPLPKSALNMIHAYLKGEPYFPRRFYNTPKSPSTERVRAELAVVVGMEEYVGPSDTDDPRRPYNRDELIKLCKLLEKRSDARPAAKP